VGDAPAECSVSSSSLTAMSRPSTAGIATSNPRNDLLPELVLKSNPDAQPARLWSRPLRAASGAPGRRRPLAGGRVVAYAQLAQQVFDTYDLEPQEAQAP